MIRTAIGCGLDKTFRQAPDAREIKYLESGASTYQPEQTMNLGAFSISLAVKDLATSKAFYQKLGFSEFAGAAAQNWLILKNGSTVIGLFQGMFEQNMLTFNPGWDSQAATLTDFTDVRDIAHRLKADGIALQSDVDAQSNGPASFIVVDPDGNNILLDQHVQKIPPPA